MMLRVLAWLANKLIGPKCWCGYQARGHNTLARHWEREGHNL